MKLKNCFFLILAVIPLVPYSASALLMRESGPEPIIIQIKESLRQSDDLDAELAKLADLQRASSLRVDKRWAGPKFLELVSFPKNFTEEQALAVIAQLQQLPAVEKVVALSAYNLEFRSGDFSREFPGNQAVPEVARRGFDKDRDDSRLLGPSNIAVALKDEHVPNRIIVRWKDEHVWKAAKTGFSQQVANMHAQAGTRVIDERKDAPNLLIQTLEFDAAKGSVASMLARYQASPWVDYAQPDYVYTINLTPNDPYYPSQPNLPQIDAPGAWNTTQGQHYKVAVGDSGATLSDPELSPNLSGGHYNFVFNNTNVADDHGHGSNVAGIIGAKGNNGYQMTGVSWHVALLILKVLNSQGTGSSYNIARAIDYAWQQGSIALNLSLGYGPTNAVDITLRDAMRRARNGNMVVVCAAGNNGVNSDISSNLFMPASIPTDNNIAVGAVDGNDYRAWFSNYGVHRVELAAPGVNIMGLHPVPGNLSFSNGTSQAAPHVTGALNLVKSVYPWENYAGIKDRVLMGVDTPGQLDGVFRTNGRLNANTSLMKRNIMRNLSTRARVEGGDRRMIGGFYIAGSGTLKVAIRGLGPSIPPLGVPMLNNPQIRLNNSFGQEVFFNNDWNNLPADQRNELIASGLAPTDGREAAMIQTLPAGGYTVFVESQDGQYGVGSFEIYEMEGNSDEQTRLVNLSTRCIVGTGNEVAIAGTILGDPGQANMVVPKRRVLAFGKGPSIPLGGTLPNPYIEFKDGAGNNLAVNDQWQDIDGPNTGLTDKLYEAGFAPSSAYESAIWPTLRPGFFTAILRDGWGYSGLGLIEFYEY